LAALFALLLVGAAAAVVLPAVAAAEQASEPGSPAAARLDVGGATFSCAIVAGGQARCWGYGADGELGYPGVTTVGATDTPASVGPVDIGAGFTATAISSGDYHTCVIRNDGSVLCWGYGADGRLGYGNTNNVGDTEAPAAAGPVDLGTGPLGAPLTAVAITAGNGFTCVILDDGSVRCWGYGAEGQLGYGNAYNVGDGGIDSSGGPDQSVASAGPVDLGTGPLGTPLTAVAISAGDMHTCAILDDGSVRCWGYGFNGQLGYGNMYNVGDGRTNSVGAPDQSVASAGPVDLGQAAVAIGAGGRHTCAVLKYGTVRCWGFGADGELGYGGTSNVGDAPQTVPADMGPVYLGSGRTAVAISAGDSDACAVLDTGSVRCWGYGGYGELGYGNQNSIGDTPTDLPGTVGPVDLGPGRTAVAISAGAGHTCARLDDRAARCWGDGANGELGYCNQSNVGDAPTDTPNTAGPVNLMPGDGGELCPPAVPAPLAVSAPPAVPAPTAVIKTAPVPNPDAARERGFRSCLARASADVKHARALAHRGSKSQRAQARRRLARWLARGRARCVRISGRTPGTVTGLHVITRGKTKIELEFTAPGTDGHNPPPATSYLVKQSLHPIRDQAEFARAATLCHGACRFAVTKIGTEIKLVITHLHPDTTYYYAIAARDNVTARAGPRSKTVEAQTMA
jgi:alpha-tubulin suppressor-like RCC1 family protein